MVEVPRALKAFHVHRRRETPSATSVLLLHSYVSVSTVSKTKRTNKKELVYWEFLYNLTSLLC